MADDILETEEHEGSFAESARDKDNRLKEEFESTFSEKGKNHLKGFLFDPKLQPDFGGVPYTQAFMLYFMRAALNPGENDANYRKFVNNFNRMAEGIDREITSMPTKHFLEDVVRPHIEPLRDDHTM